MSVSQSSFLVWSSVAFAVGVTVPCLVIAVIDRARQPATFGAPRALAALLCVAVSFALLLARLAAEVAARSEAAAAGAAGAGAAEPVATGATVALVVVFCAGLLDTVWLRHRERLQASLSTRLESARAEMRHLATHDALTGLINRFSLTDYVGALAADAQRSGTPFALMHVALDRFRVVNASMGQDVGDEVLRLCAKRIVSVLRPTDRVARIGGDEFAIVLPGVREPERVAQVATRLLSILGAQADIGRVQLHLSASVGASLFGDGGRTADELLASAATAVNSVKRSGRGGFRMYAESMSDFSRNRMALEADLMHALSRREFELHYQPMVALESGEVVGMEALLRWRHPQRGLVPPNEFIGLAEENGLIVPIGEWVLREACRQVRAWTEEGLPALSVSVNMSAVQFRRSDIVGTVASALQDTGLPARQLTIEVTESTVMTQAEESVATLEELSRMGVSLAIDDFGTGYSSLSYLRRFPIDTLKVDRSFILDATRSPDAASIVRAVVSLAHGLRLAVVAEGVEDDGQRDFLRGLGCGRAQGFLFSRPVPAEQFRQLVLAERPPACPEPVRHPPLPVAAAPERDVTADLTAAAS